MKNNSLKYKILLLSMGCFIFIKTSIAQSSMAIDASQVLSNFKFTDSEGNQDKSYSGNYSGAYSLGYRYASEGGLLIRTSIGMRKGGATLVFDGANYSWTLQYAELKLGGGYMFGQGRFKPYLSVSGYIGYLLKANQRVNNEDFDIINTQSLQKIDYGIIGSPGVQITLSDEISAYTQFSYLMGLQNIETDDNGQKASNVAYMLTLGIAFSIQ